MKHVLTLLVLVLFVSTQSLSSMPKSAEVVDKLSKKEQKKQEKRFAKIIKKIEKKVTALVPIKEAEEFFGGVTDEPKFKWGMILVALGLILRFLFGVRLAVLLTIAGIILMIIALVNY